MANENNKIKNLVSTPEDPDLPTLETPIASKQGADAEDATAHSVTLLQSELLASEQNTDRLLFDVEQLSARCTGLERELVAREQLTDKINDDLRKAREVADKRDNEVEGLRSELAVERREHDLSHKQLNSLRCALEELESRLQNPDTDLGESETESLRRQLAANEGRLTAIEAENQQLSDEITSAHYHHLHNDAYPTSGNDGTGPATATDRRVGDKEEFRELRDQVARTEQYADSLRIKLKEQIESSTEAVIARQQLEYSLEDSLAQARGLKAELENGQILEKELRFRLDQQRKEFDEELRVTRFELGNAQETVADHQTISEQLTSDLIDNQSFRQALEEQLSSTARQSEITIRELDRRLKKKMQLNDDLQRKLDNKDNAIAALLNELANRGSAKEGPAADPAADDRDDLLGVPASSGADHRVTRLLTGCVGGQKLRFPLFKDRLTIGRTGHNDIQLKAQFVSRRHAVIVSDRGLTRIVDWGSRNGVLVNRERVNEKFLKNGDTVTIGTTEFRYSERPKR